MQLFFRLHVRLAFGDWHMVVNSSAGSMQFFCIRPGTTI
jgi:hypothetical protein